MNVDPSTIAERLHDLVAHTPSQEGSPDALLLAALATFDGNALVTLRVDTIRRVVSIARQRKD